MEKDLKICIDRNPVELVNDIPEFLADGLYKYKVIGRWCATGEYVDILIQHVRDGKFSFWKIDMVARSLAFVDIDFGCEKTFLVFNIGEAIRVGFEEGEQVEVFAFEKYGQHTMGSPKGGISLFANDSKVKYELMLLDIGNVCQASAETALLKFLYPDLYF